MSEDVFCKRREVILTNKTANRYVQNMLAVDIDKLAAMLGCGHATARKIGEQAEERIVIGRRVLYSVDKIRRYLDLLAE